MVLVLAYDGEFSGPCTRKHALVALGAALVDLETGKLLEKFMTHVRVAEGREWDESTVSEFWQKEGKTFYEEILREQERAPLPDEAGILFCKWADEIAKKYEGQKIVLLSDTAGSDFSWLETILPAPRAAKMLFNRRFTPSISSTSFYLGLSSTTPDVSLNKSFAEKAALETLGIGEMPDLGVEHDHNPANDAARCGLLYAFVCRKIQEYALVSKRVRECF